MTSKGRPVRLAAAARQRGHASSPRRGSIPTSKVRLVSALQVVNSFLLSQLKTKGTSCWEIRAVKQAERWAAGLSVPVQNHALAPRCHPW